MRPFYSIKLGDVIDTTCNYPVILIDQRLIVSHFQVVTYACHQPLVALRSHLPVNSIKPRRKLLTYRLVAP